MNFESSIPTNLLGDFDEEDGHILPIFPDDDIDEKFDDLPDELPIMPLRNTVLFPGVIIPISLGRKKSLRLIKSVMKKDRTIGIVAQKDEKVENPLFEDIYETGTIARVLKIFNMPDGNSTAILQGRKRFVIKEHTSVNPNLKAKYELLDDIYPTESKDEFEAGVLSLKELSIRIIELSKTIPREATFAIKSIQNSLFLVNFIASNSDLSAKEKQEILEMENMEEKVKFLLIHLTREVQKLELKDNIQNKVRNDMDQQQREYFLNEQIKAIQDELGNGDSTKYEIEELEKKAKQIKWNDEVALVFQKQIKRLRQINPMSPDYSLQLDYLRTLAELPWGEYTKDNFNIDRAEKVLNKHHFGLDNVKERILEHLAVLKLKGDMKAPILCLYGPPGVGKTSLGKSIATALGRKYIRMALGGLHDEAEIRGHRKTYIGALPGRIIQNLKKAQSANPVFILDEIDKVGNDFRGDPSSALLEVLDPEQNSTFHDNYLEVDFDLSKVLFIATANNLNTIKPALLDRMELIEVTGYIVEEKVQIANKHLIPLQLIEHGLEKNQLKFTQPALTEIITNYTRESGVRNLNKKIAKVTRKAAKNIAIDSGYTKTINPSDVKDFLGTPKYTKEKYEGNTYAGVVTGLAWTSVGGTILFVESSLSKGNGKLTLTGNLGEVMKESAVIALEYIKSHADKLGIDNRIFDQYNVHIHVPDGSVPKDGPSAGITLVSSLVSSFTQKKVKENLAMTGEITLRGKVTPVGGIKEKILAAKRADIKEIILSKENKKDIEEIKDIYIKGLTFRYVDNIMEMLKIAILDEEVSDPIKFDLK